MKKNYILLLISAFILNFQAFAQVPVVFKIDHFLDANAFAFNQASQNNLGNDFNVSRLQYYISEISIIHDGGTKTDINNFWVLANASTTTTANLGMHNITNVEAINFSIGVDPSVNNGDPSQWSSSHPLAPKSPSMHWGWASGYRFVAMEGKAGASLTTTYEVHALGNQNYFPISIPTGASMNGGNLEITINADYTKAIKDINVTSGVISHGDNNEALTLLQNFNRSVFTSTTGAGNTLSVEDILPQNSLKIYPNPSINNQTKIKLETDLVQSAQLKIFDVTGKIILEKNISTNIESTIEFTQKGVYFISLFDGSTKLLTRKIVVQ